MQNLELEKYACTELNMGEQQETDSGYIYAEVAAFCNGVTNFFTSTGNGIIEALNHPVNLLMIVTVFLALSSCHNDDKASLTSLDQTNTISKIESDNFMINLQKIRESRMNAVAKDRYSFSKIDNNLLKNGIRYCKSEQEVLALYKKAGMTNAEEYFASTKKELEIFGKIAQKYPGITSFSPDSKERFIKRMLGNNKEMQRIMAQKQGLSTEAIQKINTQKNN